MSKLPDDIEQQLRKLSDSEWDALTARLRPPDASEALRDAASQHISGDQLEAFCKIARVSEYVGETGQVDADKLGADLRTLFDLPSPPAVPQQRWANFGQHQPPPPPPAPAPGQHGSAEAGRRFRGAKRPAGSATAQAELEKRFGGDR